MKNVIYLIGIILSVMLASCNGINGNTTSTRHSTGRIDVDVITLTVDTISHEYLHIPYGLTHYPECKFCKAKKQHEIVAITSDLTEISIYYTGSEISPEKKNDIRTYLYKFTINEVNTEEFEDIFYRTFNLENCKFNY